MPEEGTPVQQGMGSLGEIHGLEDEQEFTRVEQGPAQRGQTGLMDKRHRGILLDPIRHPSVGVAEGELLLNRLRAWSGVLDRVLREITWLPLGQSNAPNTESCS
jgi:hypothetical protein